MSSAALARALDEVLKAGAELVIVFGASAIADRRDVIPAALEAIGGRIEHFGMPVDPGNLLMIGDAAGRAGARRAGLRAQPEGERLRLGADAAAGRPAGAARGHHRPRRRRPADGDRDAAAAARGAGAEPAAPSPRSCSPPADRAAWAARTSFSPRSAAGRWCASSPKRRWLAGAAGDRRHRPSARAGRGGACRPAGQIRAQSAFRRRARHLAQGRHRRAAGRTPTAPSSASATCRRSMPP